MSIHPTAIISPKAEIDPSVEIGPYVVIDGEVKIGPNCRISSHVRITGYTTLGANNEIHSFAVIGDTPQDFAFKSDVRSYVRIGDNNVMREGFTIHRGTYPETETTVGNGCFFMANSHIAHNCHVADHVKMANGAALAGHVHVGEGTFISAYVGVHQFARIGRLCMIAALCRITMDLPHFMMGHGDSTIVGVNRVGLRRAGFTSEQVTEIRSAYRFLFRSGIGMQKAAAQLREQNPSGPVAELIDFITAPSKRGIAGPPTGMRLGRTEEDAHE